VIVDRFQKQGLGQQLMERSITIASQEKYKAMHAQILKDNAGMLHLTKKSGFILEPSQKNPAIINAVKYLSN
jgi:L-amino acid N-acyltransferase YncA